nr:pentapeptide repeat-containing protein [uncultured Brevundimonas sp.]
MTDQVQSPFAAVGPGPAYDKVGIWLPQLYLEAAREGQFTIENRTFSDCLFEGAAVILPIEGCHFDDCFFGEHGGDPHVLMLAPLGGYQVVGAIPFRNCRFERCRFLGVGFTGAADFLQQLVGLLGGETLAPSGALTDKPKA